MSEETSGPREWVFTPQRVLVFFVHLLSPWVAALAAWNIAWQRIDQIPCFPDAHMPAIPAYFCVVMVSAMCWVGATELSRRGCEWFLRSVVEGAPHA